MKLIGILNSIAEGRKRILLFASQYFQKFDIKEKYRSERTKSQEVPWDRARSGGEGSLVTGTLSPWQRCVVSLGIEWVEAWERLREVTATWPSLPTSRRTGGPGKRHTPPSHGSQELTGDWWRRLPTPAYSVQVNKVGKPLFVNRCVFLLLI